MMRWVKEYLINIELLAFYLFCIFIANHSFPQKVFLIWAFIFILCFESIRNFSILKKQFSFLKVISRFSNLNKFRCPWGDYFISVSGVFSFLSVAAFYFCFIAFAFNEKGIVQYGILSFIIFNVISAISVFIESYSSLINEANKVKWVFSIFFAIAFPCAYALADSVFLHETSMNLSDSPWISYTLKTIYFGVLFCLFFQVFFFSFYLKLLDGLSVVHRIAFLITLGTVSLLMNASLFWLNNLTYFAIDNGVKFEWREEAYCQGKNVAKKGD